MSLLLFTIECLLYYISSAATFPNDCKEINISIYGNHNKTVDGIYIVNQIFNNNILYLTKINHKKQINLDNISIKLITQANIIMISDDKINETLRINSFNCIHNKQYNNILLSASIHSQIKQYINNPFNDSNILITYIISAIIILLLIFSICLCCCYCNNCCNCCCKKSIPSKHSDSDNSHTNYDKNNITNDINGTHNDQHNITPFLPSNNITPFDPVDNINVIKPTKDKAQYLRVQMNQLNRNSTTSQYSQWSDLSNKTNQTNISNNTISESSTFTQDMSSRDVRNGLLYVTPKPESIIHQQSSSNNTYTDIIPIQDIIGSVSNNNIMVLN
eukprot:485774_1